MTKIIAGSFVWAIIGILLASFLGVTLDVKTLIFVVAMGFVSDLIDIVSKAMKPE